MRAVRRLPDASRVDLLDDAFVISGDSRSRYQARPDSPFLMSNWTKINKEWHDLYHPPAKRRSDRDGTKTSKKAKSQAKVACPAKS